ncbi:type II secretion system F family protein [Streptomyces sp. MI02-2A]|uniref:type II secretion system F family protein n=1 Tax=Streptomyces sp. MI02-2A TaxID=3028688 RepID=UPI0029A7C5D6|nr:type II secretion system F family protein [Streptomyces sp. MI02-2A]MDX3258718.1 type II secretion system F family protein [Streptomyces sp. MI02-2A]
MSVGLVHRLGMLCGVAALWWAMRLMAAARRERRARRRLTAVLGAGGPAEVRRTPASLLVAGWGRAAGAGPVGRWTGAPGAAAGELSTGAPGAAGRRGEARDTARRWLPVAGALCAGWVLLGGFGGPVAGLVVGLGVRRWRDRQEADRLAEEYNPAVAARRLPSAADLLAACIAAGATPVAAAQAVGEALEGPVGERLARGAAEVRLGAEPADAWRRLASLPGAAPLARLLERAGDSGAPAAAPVGRLAADARAEWGRTATARARRAGVMVTAPVGLCFLPAFIAVGVLPVVIGLAGGLLGGGGR